MGILYIMSITAATRDNELYIYSGAIMFGISGAILWNSQHHYLIEISAKDNLGTNSGYFVGIYSMGSAIGVFILGYFIDVLGYQAAFNGFILVTLISIYLFSGMEAKHVNQEQSKQTSFFSTFRSKTLTLLAMATSLLPHLVYALIVSLIPIHVQQLSNNAYLIGIISTIYFVILMLLSKRFGALSDDRGRGKMIIIGLMLSITGLGVFIVAESITLLIVGTIFISIANSILLPMQNALQGDISTVGNRSLVTSSFMFFKYIGIILGFVLGYTLTISMTYIATAIIIIVVLSASYSLLMRVSGAEEEIALELTAKPITHMV